MFDQLFQGFVAAILAADTATAISVLHDNHALFMDPLQGGLFHAKALYYAIKKANLEIIKQLLHLNVHSDVYFYNFCGESPISLVLSEGLKEVIPEILSKTDKSFALALAVKLHDNKAIDYLLSHCAFKDRFLNYLGLKQTC